MDFTGFYRVKLERFFQWIVIQFWKLDLFQYEFRVFLSMVQGLLGFSDCSLVHHVVFFFSKDLHKSGFDQGLLGFTEFSYEFHFPSLPVLPSPYLYPPLMIKNYLYLLL